MVNDLSEPLPVLDELNTRLKLPGLSNGVGRLEARLEDVLTLYQNLFAGQEPKDALSRPMQASITRLRLPHYCAGRQELSEQVVLSLLWHLDSISLRQDRWGETWSQAQTQAGIAFAAEWQAITIDYETVYAIFDDLGGLAKTLDASALNALIKSSNWSAVLAAHALIKRLPKLSELIARLGRREASSEQSPELETVMVQNEVPTFVPDWQPLAQETPAGETIGTRQAQDLANMLASEAVLMRHPILKKRWRAQFVEHELLCHERELMLTLPHAKPQLQSKTTPELRPKPKASLGPIIVCVDTSASMQGGKELISKAAVFEAMKQAHLQARRCYLYCFSGPDNLTEHELSLNQEGLAQLGAFLNLSFHGGTDFTEPLTRAIARVGEAAWRDADILVVSDGEFGVVREVAEHSYQIKKDLALQVIGLLIGDRETIGLLEISDEVVWLDNWRDFDPELRGATQPVHSKSLTKLYFPGALEHRKNLA